MDSRQFRSCLIGYVCLSTVICLLPTLLRSLFIAHHSSPMKLPLPSLTFQHVWCKNNRMYEVSDWFDRILIIINRIFDNLPSPWNTLSKYTVLVIVVVSILTFLMRLWQRIKPTKRIEDINKVSGKHASSIKREAKMAERAGNFRAAGDSWRALGQTKRAMELFKKAGAMDRAGDLLISDGKISEAITLWENSGNYVLAAKQLDKDGQFERAALNYSKANNYSQAAEMFERAGINDKAGEFYAKAGFFAKAGSNFSKAGMTLPAAKAFEKYFQEQAVNLTGKIEPQRAQNIKDLAKRGAILYQKAGKKEEAAELFLKGGFLPEAAHIFEDLGLTERAAKLYEEAGSHDHAARLFAGTDNDRAKTLMAESLRSQGKIAEAAKAFAEGQDYVQAGEMYAQAEMPREAAMMFMQAGSYIDAAGLFMQAGDRAQAASAYEAARDFETAIKLRDQIGDAEGAIRALFKSDRKVEAAQRLLKLGRTNDAYQALQEIKPDDPGYREACLIMAKVHAGAGRTDIAIQLIQRGVKGDPVGPETMELYYILGRLFEQRRDYPLAVEIYSKIFTENIAYKDVAMRRQSIMGQLAQTGVPVADATHEKTMVYEQQGGARQNPRYKIIQELGRGGMGVVYKAMDTVLDRLVAYKVLPPDLKNHPKVVESFSKEAKALAALHHPNIVMVFDAGGIGGEYFFAMEYVEGKNLKEKLQETGRIPLEDTIRIATDLADALNFAHNRKIAHRDIKTSNVMISAEGRVKLMDFGLAKVLGEAAAGRTAVSGTPYYMSPEQTTGEGIDHRTDLYSLGVLIYELATGSVPFKDGDIGYHHMHTEPTPPRSINPEIPPALEAIILKCMRKKKEERYQSAGEILADLKRVEKT